MVKTQPAVAPGGRYTKDDFTIDLGAAGVTCPARASAPIGFRGDGSGVASFGAQGHGCHLRQQCTSAAEGRTVQISRHHLRLVAARVRQRDRPDRPTIKPIAPRLNVGSTGWPR